MAGSPPIKLAHPDVLRAAVEAAVLAPSTHNTQPWRFRIAGTTLDVFADPDRQLHVIDGDRRQQIMSCGCALYNARVAVRAHGYEDEVTVMLADSDRPNLLATLHLGEHRITDEDDRALFEAIRLRHTNRRPFLPRPIASVVIDEMIELAAREGVAMVRALPDTKHSLGAIVDEADRLQYGDPAFRDELAKWLAPFGSRRRDGIPFVEKEFGSAITLSVVRALRSPHVGEEFGHVEAVNVDAAPAVLVMGTAGDEPVDWLRCGEALEAVLLAATRRGLSAAFLNQALELPELRAKVAELLPELGVPQMILRLGVPDAAIRRVAPRRDISDVLDGSSE